ncbi:MAG TPA: altronate dehydratase family protein [Bryobacteraceae bacterium]|nr:altronate dehydratase family protein [Bryobacteraceae bacterium]
MSDKLLQVDPRDNVVMALTTLDLGAEIRTATGSPVVAKQTILPKHKIAVEDLQPGDPVRMYGMVVGEVVEAIPRGGLLTTQNVRHRAGAYTAARQPVTWPVPDPSPWAARTFMGYHRADGQVGTRNYWIVLPLVFCENRNIEQMKEALEEELGYGRANAHYRERVRRLIATRKNGTGPDDMPSTSSAENGRSEAERVFPNLDGVRFITHQLGCGGTRQDARGLCGLLAGYIHNPNVAGATVLSLGCQNAQSALLMQELRALDPELRKPVIVVDQQKSGQEATLMEQAIDRTFAALAQANMAERAPAPLSALNVALQCGGSDGYSGVSANPTIGYVSDLVAGLGGTTILSEFPELHGVEQELINRCATDELAERFAHLMQNYAEQARAAQSSFAFNPSPGNIREGLITDAMKSAGAARKGGFSTIRGVLDYPEYATTPGLNLQCTPGNDVESVTAQVGAGANIVLFTTGLGTPTGNPVAPVIKLSTNSTTATRMSDIIDFDAGTIVTGRATVEECGKQLFEMAIDVASGKLQTKAEMRGQIDFIPWKRGVSL